MLGIPCLSRSTLPCAKPGYVVLMLYLFRIVLITALKANCPRQRTAFRSLNASISLARYAEQLDVSSGVGLLSGGAHLTAAVTYAFFSLRPSSELFEVGWFAKPVL